MFKKCCIKLHSWLNITNFLDFIAPLALRLYLVPVFWMAGITKWYAIDSTIRWFGNSDWGLGLPYPTLMAYAATLTEIIGAVCLAVGILVRWVSIPLMIVMIMAAVLVHWENGWHAIAIDASVADQRLHQFMSWLIENHPQRHRFLTQHGQPVVLNNGVEFAVTYFIMLLSLFFTGAGKYVSLDYWFDKYLYQDNKAFFGICVGVLLAIAFYFRFTY